MLLTLITLPSCSNKGTVSLFYLKGICNGANSAPEIYEFWGLEVTSHCDLPSKNINYSLLNADHFGSFRFSLSMERWHFAGQSSVKNIYHERRVTLIRISQRLLHPTRFPLLREQPDNQIWSGVCFSRWCSFVAWRMLQTPRFLQISHVTAPITTKGTPISPTWRVIWLSNLIGYLLQPMVLLLWLGVCIRHLNSPEFRMSQRLLQPKVPWFPLLGE